MKALRSGVRARTGKSRQRVILVALTRSSAAGEDSSAGRATTKLSLAAVGSRSRHSETALVRRARIRSCIFAPLAVISTRALRMSTGSGARSMRPSSSSLVTMRESIVGFNPSSSASSERGRGPWVATTASTEDWLGVSPSAVEVTLSCRAIRAMALRSRATIRRVLSHGVRFLKGIRVSASKYIWYAQALRELRTRPAVLLWPIPCISYDLNPGRKSPIPGARPHTSFFLVSMALFMSSIDQTIVATALPSIQRELHSTINWSSWTITIYALGQVLAMPLAGRISDQYGRKKVFLAAVVLFTATSLCCGLAQNIYELVLLRALQAIGGGSFTALGHWYSSSDHFGRERSARGMFLRVCSLSGGVVGPILGGVFVAVWSWRGIFLVNVPIGIVLFVLAARFVPHSAPRAVA